MKLSIILLLVGVVFAATFLDNAEAGFRFRRAIRRVRVRIRWRRLAKPACMAACSAITNAWGAAACRLACTRAKRDVNDQMAAIPIEFEKYDKNQDLKISRDELAELTQLSLTELDGIFSVADTDKDGYLDKTEFYSAPFDFFEDDKEQLEKLVNDSDLDELDLDDL